MSFPPASAMPHGSSFPWVEIVVQPASKGSRFRYQSESRTAGSILGEYSTIENRTYPTIKVHNYIGPLYAEAFCVTTDGKLHPHKLVGSNCDADGVCQIQTIDASYNTISFSNIGIQCCTKKFIAKNLEERRKRNIHNLPIPTNFDTLDLSTVCLLFQVYVNQRQPLQPVISQPIVDKKVCCDLAICRLSKTSGSVSGGDEVFILCNKVKKEDIQVVFCHQLEDGTTWEAKGDFSPADVFKQYVIVFRCPPYKYTNIQSPVEVSLYLMRPSDNEVGEPKSFTYYPENPDPFGIELKRKRKMLNVPSIPISCKNPQNFSNNPTIPSDNSLVNFILRKVDPSNNPPNNPSFPPNNPSFPPNNPSFPPNNPSFLPNNPSFPPNNPSFPSNSFGTTFSVVPSSVPYNSPGFFMNPSTTSMNSMPSSMSRFPMNFVTSTDTPPLPSHMNPPSTKSGTPSSRKTSRSKTTTNNSGVKTEDRKPVHSKSNSLQTSPFNNPNQFAGQSPHSYSSAAATKPAATNSLNTAGSGVVPQSNNIQMPPNIPGAGQNQWSTFDPSFIDFPIDLDFFSTIGDPDGVIDENTYNFFTDQ